MKPKEIWHKGTLRTLNKKCWIGTVLCDDGTIWYLFKQSIRTPATILSLKIGNRVDFSVLQDGSFRTIDKIKKIIK